MDAARALADLTEVSSQVRGAVIVDAEGTTVASTFAAEVEESVGAAAATLLRAAKEMPRESGRAELTQLEAALPGGSVFVVDGGAHAIAAVTARSPTSGLVFYDLKTALRRAFEDEPANQRKKPARRTKREDDA
ncbi:MAG: roadblock/LC7 domain-containing protein [Actinobacteria bacterium]|nr:roadblock/LC7 domain-containing protein [Actinomycetota bacterium]